MTDKSLRGQALAKDNNALDTILKQLRSGTYSTKKTACHCMISIVQGNGPNSTYAIQNEAVPVLSELINDEDDDELSNKAFECLESLGPKVISELMKYLKLALSKVVGIFAKSKTLIIDIYR